MAHSVSSEDILPAARQHALGPTPTGPEPDAPRPPSAANLAYLAAERAMAATQLAEQTLNATGGEVDHSRVGGLLTVADTYRHIAETLGGNQHAIAPPRPDK